MTPPSITEISTPPDLRLVADVVVTVDGSDRILSPGVVDMAGDEIIWVGDPAEAPVLPDEPGGDDSGATRVLEIGGLLMPGLVNVHCHSPMTLLRGAGEGLPLHDWLTGVMWPREALMTSDDVWWGMTLAADELLRYGVTTTCEMYLWSEALGRAAATAGLRSVVCSPIVDGPGWDRFGTWQDQARAAVDLREQFAEDPLIEIGIAPHSAYTVPAEALELAAATAVEHGMLLHTHVAESHGEDLHLREEYGSVPRMFEQLGLLEVPRLLAAHCVWMDDTDLDLFAGAGVSVAHCPQSNAKIASGTARLTAMLGRDMKVGLGTDGPASNNNLNLWEEIRLAPLLARLHDLDPEAVPATKALAMATSDAAAALGRSDLGALEAGRKADIIRLDLDDVAFVPTLAPEDIISHLVWSASARTVTDVWVGGRRVVADGRTLTVDDHEARRQVTERAQRLAREAHP